MWDTTKVDVGAYEATWNAGNLGGVHEVSTNLQLLRRALKIGSAGEMMLDTWFAGLNDDAMVSVVLAETALAQLRTMVPWDNGSGSIDLAPPVNTRLYQYAQQLVIHPIDQGAGTTKDVKFFKTVPIHNLPVPRKGTVQTLWKVDFLVFPDHTKLQAGTPAYFEVAGA